MPASGYTPILIYASGTATSVPSAANMTSSSTGAELALNYADGKLYYKDSGGSVQLLASKAANNPVTTFSAGTTGLTPSTATSGAVTLAGTLNVANGGTGLTSVTANYIPYGNGTSALSTNSGFTFNGTTLTAPAAALTISALTSSNTSNLQIGGTTSFSDTGIVSNFVGTTNSYLQAVLQNKSNGTAASTEFIAYNDSGTAATNFATVGINSSGYSGTGSINAAGYGYFLTGSTDLVLGTIGANSIHFTVNSSANDAMVINGTTQIVSFPTTGAITLPVGTTAQEPASPAAGMLRFNSSTSQFEGYNGSAWASVGGAALSNDTSTATPVYPLFSSATSGTALTIYTSNANYLYTPSTGLLQAPNHYSSNGVTLNGTTISKSFTFPTGANGFSVGNVSVNTGITVTVPSGQRWIVI